MSHIQGIIIGMTAILARISEGIYIIHCNSSKQPMNYSVLLINVSINLMKSFDTLVCKRKLTI